MRLSTQHWAVRLLRKGHLWFWSYQVPTKGICGKWFLALGELRNCKTREMKGFLFWPEHSDTSKDTVFWTVMAFRQVWPYLETSRRNWLIPPKYEMGFKTNLAHRANVNKRGVSRFALWRRARIGTISIWKARQLVWMPWLGTNLVFVFLSAYFLSRENTCL